MRKTKSLRPARAGLVAAVYVLLVLLGLPLASGVIQLRFAESLVVLGYYLPEAVPGLGLGCLLANLLMGAPLPDIVFGSLATLLGAWGLHRLRRRGSLALLPPIAANGIIVPLLLRYAYGAPGTLLYLVLTVSAGEALSVGLLGGLLHRLLEKNKETLFREDRGE